MPKYVSPVGSMQDLFNAIKDETDKIADVKTETDKMPATITKVDEIKVETDKIPDVKIETDKMPATIAKVDFMRDIVPLVVASTSPADEATDVAIDSSVTITFDRGIYSYARSDDSVIDNVTVVDEDSTAYTIASIDISANVLTLNIDGDFANAKVVTVTVPVDAVFGDNNNGVLESPYVFSFTTIA